MPQYDPELQARLDEIDAQNKTMADQEQSGINPLQDHIAQTSFFKDLLDAQSKIGTFRGVRADSSTPGMDDMQKARTAELGAFLQGRKKREQEQIGSKQATIENYFRSKAGEKELAAKADAEKSRREFDAHQKELDRKNELAKAKVGAQAKTDIASAKTAPVAKGYKEKIASLPAAEKARFDNTRLAATSLNKMKAHLNKGGDRYSVFGDNDYTQNLALFEEAIGRMQSGGAITNDEGARFKTMARSLMDNPEQQQKKLDDLIAEMNSRYSTLGFDESEIEDPAYLSSKQVLAESIGGGSSPGTAIAGTKNSAKDAQALQWAKNNPGDPRAQVILKKLGQ
jgi:hypothetical protein